MKYRAIYFKLAQASVSVALGTIILTGCNGYPPWAPCKDLKSNDSAMFPPVYLVDTAAFEKKKATFKITPDQARELAMAAVTEEIEESFGSPTRIPGLIVGDDYLFNPFWEKMQVHLDGYFVNGFTGEVSIKQTNHAVSYSEIPDAAGTPFPWNEKE